MSDDLKEWAKSELAKARYEYIHARKAYKETKKKWRDALRARGLSSE